MHTRNFPKNHWTLQWRGLTMQSIVLGSPNLTVLRSHDSWRWSCSPWYSLKMPMPCMNDGEVLLLWRFSLWFKCFIPEKITLTQDMLIETWKYMGVSENSGFSPQIIHFNRVFHHKPSNLGYPYFGKHPYQTLAPHQNARPVSMQAHSYRHRGLQKMEQSRW